MGGVVGFLAYACSAPLYVALLHCIAGQMGVDTFCSFVKNERSVLSVLKRQIRSPPFVGDLHFDRHVMAGDFLDEILH